MVSDELQSHVTDVATALHLLLALNLAPQDLVSYLLDLSSSMGPRDLVCRQLVAIQYDLSFMKPAVPSFASEH